LSPITDIILYLPLISISEYNFPSKSKDYARLPLTPTQAQTPRSVQLLKKNILVTKRSSYLTQDGNNQDVVRWASNGIGFIVVN